MTVCVSCFFTRSRDERRRSRSRSPKITLKSKQRRNKEAPGAPARPRGSAARPRASRRACRMYTYSRRLNSEGDARTTMIQHIHVSPLASISFLLYLLTLLASTSLTNDHIAHWISFGDWTRDVMYTTRDVVDSCMKNLVRGECDETPSETLYKLCTTLFQRF